MGKIKIEKNNFCFATTLSGKLLFYRNSLENNNFTQTITLYKKKRQFLYFAIKLFKVLENHRWDNILN